MTLQEAQQEVDVCEYQITSAYKKLISNAQDVGSTAFEAAWRAKQQTEYSESNEVARKTFLSLLISLFGLLLCAFSHPGWGFFLIIAGIVVAYFNHNSASMERNRMVNGADKILTDVKAQQETLNNIIDHNKGI